MFLAEQERRQGLERRGVGRAGVAARRERGNAGWTRGECRVRACKPRVSSLS